ncbi:thioredoxin [Halegenticoccus tardaugens]|uniref:thioredoxin n=1 Tax=Halegenticoccus tardaugens TaxID=2071624 RepID=UPI00100A61AF|nr:thioredoxin [Halegenticoccus tardaugens]
MSDSDELAEIRRRKRERLEERLRGRAVDGPTASPAEPIHVRSPEHFAELLEANETVLVDFYADWCGPCRTLEPIVSAVARDTPAAVAKVDIDARRALAEEYGVRSVPTMVLFAAGRPVERIVGVQGKDALVALVDRYAGRES